jgi:hypothetical protein
MLLQLLQNLGFTIRERKLVPSTQILTFLGVELNTVTCTMTLPNVKLLEFQALVETFQHKYRASKTQLQRLAGKLNWACRVVYRGRTFLRRVLDTINSLTSPLAKYKLSPSFHEDILWWVKCLKVFNGTKLFLDAQPTVDVMTCRCMPRVGRGLFPGGLVLP